MDQYLFPWVRNASFAFFLGCVLVNGASAQNVVHDAKSEELAKEWCSRCHNVEPGGPFKQFPPSFSAISVYRSAEQIYSRIVVPPLHSNMPQLSYVLTPDNIDNLVAYIVSLESK